MNEAERAKSTRRTGPAKLRGGVGGGAPSGVIFARNSGANLYLDLYTDFGLPSPDTILKRNSMQQFGVILLTCSFCFVGLQKDSTAEDATKPNILFVLIDNLGKDWFDCYGSVEGCTPNLDALAHTGVRFEHCYTTSFCSTTRALLYTGRYGRTTGWHTHHDTAIYGGGYLDWQRETVFARFLRNAGYATCVTGKWQLNDFYDPAQVNFPNRHGFDEHLLWTGAINGSGTAEKRHRDSVAAGLQTHNRIMESRYYDPVVFKNGERIEARDQFGPALYVDYLIGFMRRHRDRPFLAYYASPSVHRPLIPTPLNPTTPADAPDRELWAGMVRYLDHQIGELVAALEELDLREKTIVVVTTDNGTWGGLGGNTVTGPVKAGLGRTSESGLDIPLIINAPGFVKQPRVCTALVDQSDFLPTFAELAGIKVERRATGSAVGARESGATLVDGKSFASLITGATRDEDHRDWVYSQHADLRILRDRRYKLYSTGEFFDLEKDPIEDHDLAASADLTVAAARERLTAILTSFPPDAHPFEPRSSFAFRLRERGRPATRRR